MVIALRGYDGKELWRMNVTAGPFMINCHDIDVDKDGKADCIASGRVGTATAFDPRKGKVLWHVDHSVVHQSWNFYNVLVMPDFTGDGVPEVLLPHGGEPKFKASQHKRHAGRLVLVDGSNGRSLGRYLNMRRYKETYISPVLHTTRDGSQYILYGEGGETVKGSFLGISVPDLYRYVRNLPKSAPVPHTRGNYKSWEKRKWYHRKHGIFVIYKSQIEGVMVPPTLVDMNNDGVRDIMMTAYDGLIRLYDGDTLDVMWTTKFHGFETYSCFAPAYFNDDDTLDFMIHLNRGVWPHYKYALKVVLDGRNGNVLWTLNATWSGMASDLVLRTTERHRDAYLFRMEGVNGPVDNEVRKTGRERGERGEGGER
ncbi:hypothetical protein NP493_504g03043 [Ridgeia piscesae]|uniref:FAM234A/B beta-propeller domain-containing protein n=1 Tax=Ridgeia piscesae TaxID=27915 RepID=A0AAD9KXK5_RIDPI|nr:hypothetical protein NP493_504g03043 [Ridgeia piscesae]